MIWTTHIVQTSRSYHKISAILIAFVVRFTTTPWKYEVCSRLSVGELPSAFRLTIGYAYPKIIVYAVHNSPYFTVQVDVSLLLHYKFFLIFEFSISIFKTITWTFLCLIWLVFSKSTYCIMSLINLKDIQFQNKHKNLLFRVGNHVTYSSYQAYLQHFNSLKFYLW